MSQHHLIPCVEERVLEKWFPFRWLPRFKGKYCFCSWGMIIVVGFIAFSPNPFRSGSTTKVSSITIISHGHRIQYVTAPSTNVEPAPVIIRWFLNHQHLQLHHIQTPQQHFRLQVHYVIILRPRRHHSHTGTGKRQ